MNTIVNITEQNTEIKPLSIVKTKFMINAKFPSLNKQDNFDRDYMPQMESTQIKKVEVQEIITLTNQDFVFFKTSLMNNQTWLDGKGGTDSTFNTDHVEHFWSLTEIEKQKFIDGAYNTPVMVQNENGENILVDPQGYKYARYCGIVATK